MISSIFKWLIGIIIIVLLVEALLYPMKKEEECLKNHPGLVVIKSVKDRNSSHTLLYNNKTGEYSNC